MDYKIITDSCCDFTDLQYSSMDVAFAPLTVMYEETCHSHFSNETTLNAFYAKMRQGLTATTSALNPDNWACAMIGLPCLSVKQCMVFPVRTKSPVTELAIV